MLAQLGAATAHGATLTLAWDPPSDGRTAGYLVWYGKTAGQYTAYVDAGAQLKYAVDGLADGTTYCFAVQAYDGTATKSAMSSEICTRTPDAPPPPGSEPPSSGDPTVASDIVLYASNASVTRGNWMAASSSGAAGGRAMRSADLGWSTVNTPHSAPANHYAMTFSASANTPYRIWLRLRAAGNSKWNDSVWVQFSDALVGGQPRYRIGTTSALLVNLEPCSGCRPAGWGWQNTAYWLRQATTVTFEQSGTHTIRVQTREDGVEIDQIVLSAAKFTTTAPGSATNDTTILASSTSASSATPYSGTPLPIPGTIEAAHFDGGGANVAYADTTPGNTGGAFRATDVDLEASSLGGFNIGWTEPGEWVSYTVYVQYAGAYTARFRVASMGGGALRIAASNDTRDIVVPDSRGWQSWTTVSVPITLAAGRQTIRLRFLTGRINLRSVGLQRQ